MDIRRFKLVYDLSGGEVYSWTYSRRLDQRADAAYRMRRNPNSASAATFISTPTPLAEGTTQANADPTRRQALAAHWARRASWHWLMRDRSQNHELPIDIVSTPDAKQNNIRFTTRTLHDAVHAAWTKRRQSAVEGSHNRMVAQYAWEDWSSPVSLMLDEIQRHMLEPVINHGRYYLDTLWTSSEVFGFLSNRVNDFLLRTGVVRETTTLSIPANSPAVALPAAVNELRRAVWTAGGESIPLKLEDFTSADTSPGWESTSGTPSRLITWGRGRVELSPPNSTAGSLMLDYVPMWDTSTYATADFVSAVLPVPSLCTPFIKYGVMADMFNKEGEAQDTKRAAYCEERYQQGIDIMVMFLGRKY